MKPKSKLFMVLFNFLVSFSPQLGKFLSPSIKPLDAASSKGKPLSLKTKNGLILPVGNMPQSYCSYSLKFCIHNEMKTLQSPTPISAFDYLMASIVQFNNFFIFSLLPPPECFPFSSSGLQFQTGSITTPTKGTMTVIMFFCTSSSGQ